MIRIEQNDILQPLTGQFDVTFVIISVLLACITSVIALFLLTRIENKSFVYKSLWIIAAAIALSFGYWSMHYMGLLAYHTKIQMSYSIPMTIFSMLPIFVASLGALQLLTVDRLTKYRGVLASVLQSIGVSSMHLLGVHSLEGYVYHRFGIWTVIVGLLLPFLVFRMLTLYYHRSHYIYTSIIFGVLLGLSVSAAHYLLMYGMTMYVLPSNIIYNEFLPYEHSNFFASILILSVGLIVSLLILLMIMDYLLMKRIERFDTVTHLSNSQQLFKDMQHENFKQMALWIFQDVEYINKTYGYHYGDVYIKQVADRVRLCILENMQIYRTGENQLLLVTTVKNEHFLELQQNLALMLAEPVTLVDGLAPIEPKAVCALSNDEEASSKELLKQVIAVSRLPHLIYDFSIITYNAKVHSFNVQDQVILGIDEAMENNELFLVYQPKIFAKTNELSGFEALLRWRHHEYGFISPGVFVPMLEQIGKMDSVTNWVIEKVCQKISDCKRRGIDMAPIAINIPGEYLISDSLKKWLSKMMKKYDVTPQDIELELTETSFVQNIELAVRAMQYYNDLGFGIALDDFGTGLSSLSYLRQMQITTLKVDKSFIDHVPHYQKDVAIATTIIALAEALDVKVVVEGVETQEQLDFVLSTSKNPIVQGYYYSKPLTVEELEAYLQKDSLNPNSN